MRASRFYHVAFLGSVLAVITVTAAIWVPRLEQKFNYQLGVAFDPVQHIIPGVQVYFIDGFDTPNATVQDITARGLFPVCYFSAGSFEDWRPDAGDFLPSDKGAPLGDWPGEWWLDIRSENVKAIMRKRMEMCKSKGFVAVDPDNVDGYSNANGLKLNASDQLAYNTWIANTAHELGLAVGLKNDLGQVPELVEVFDFFVNEQCARFRECELYGPVKTAGKPVWNVEYRGADFAKACSCQSNFGITTIRKYLKLNLNRKACKPSKKACTLTSRRRERHFYRPAAAG